MADVDERSGKIRMAIGKAVLELLDEQNEFSDTELDEILEEWMENDSNLQQSEIYRDAAEFVRSGTPI
ncbi:hypothetical protein XB02_19430 [Pantoea ananatis]|nr:hypothetical protein XB02_19430 [Pantoea ananatis]